MNTHALEKSNTHGGDFSDTHAGGFRSSQEVDFHLFLGCAIPSF